MKRKPSSPDQIERMDRIISAIASLEKQKQRIFASGEVAPPGTVVSRYQVRQQQKIYWYYKLQAQEPIFPKANDTQAKSKYKHLGSSGSPAHISAVMQVVRMSQVDEIQRSIDTLEQALLNIGYDEQSSSQ